MHMHNTVPLFEELCGFLKQTHDIYAYLHSCQLSFWGYCESDTESYWIIYVNQME